MRITPTAIYSVDEEGIEHREEDLYITAPQGFEIDFVLRRKLTDS